MIVATIVLPIVVFFVGIVLFFGSFAVFRMVRGSKGTLVLHIPQTSVSTDEKIRGTVTITPKKQLAVRRFFVALTCEEVVRRPGEEAPEMYLAYSDEYTFPSDKQWPAGLSQSFEFELTVPHGSNVNNGAKVTGGSIGTEIGGVGVRIGRERRLLWKVEARVDLSGFDLAKCQLVNVKLDYAR